MSRGVDSRPTSKRSRIAPSSARIAKVSLASRAARLGTAEEGEVAQEDAEQQLAEDGGLAERARRRAEELRAHEDEGEREQDAGVLVVAGGGGEEEAVDAHRDWSVPASSG